MSEKRADLRDSVRDYRNPATTADERQGIADWWKSQGIPNQFAAMLRAADEPGGCIYCSSSGIIEDYDGDRACSACGGTGTPRRAADRSE
jgi:hypothetical protein